MYHWRDQSFKPRNPWLLLQLGRKQNSIDDEQQRYIYSQRFANMIEHGTTHRIVS